MIIAPKAFHAALEPYVVFKRAHTATELVSLEDVLRDSSGVDDPERLKRFLYVEWRNDGLRYVLLVGDADIMPVRYMVLDRITPAAFDYAFYASDLYYADVAKANESFEDWNAKREGFHRQYFGEVRGEKNKNDPINYDDVDFDPELAIGRWPVDTADEVRLVAQKSMTYETGVIYSNKPGLRTVGLLACGGWVDGRPLMNELATKLPDWKAEKRYYTDSPATSHPDSPGGPNSPGGPDEQTPPPDAAQVTALMNAGAELIVHIGHGGIDNWSGCFSINDLASLKNADRLPIVISAGCSTAVFASGGPYEAYTDIAGKLHAGTNDNKEVFTEPPPPPGPYQKGQCNPTSLGEQMIRRDLNGAVAYIGCNTGGQPCALTLVDGFVRSIGEIPQARLGDCWNEAVRYYIEKEKLSTIKPDEGWYPPSVFYQPMKYMVFGDPSLPMPSMIQWLKPAQVTRPGRK